jgi:hypothetical protein
MKRHEYIARIKARHGVLIARLYRNGVLVMDHTALSVEDAKATMYRHYVRLSELDDIEETAKVS